jgi:hypothetical protein
MKELDLDAYDAWYLKEYVREKGVEIDDDYWLDESEERGVSVQIEYFAEHDPRQSINILTRFAAYDREANGEKVVEAAHYEVRVTKYTQAGLDAKFKD